MNLETKEGMSASEWMLRTGIAEKRLAAAQSELQRMQAECEKIVAGWDPIPRARAALRPEGGEGSAEPSLACHICQKKHAVVYQVCPECYGSLRQRLQDAQKEILRFKEEVLLLAGLLADEGEAEGDTLPAKEK